MAYSKTDPRHAMNRELTGPSMITKIKQGHKSGMADRKSGRKKGVNCSTGRYATK